VFNRGVEGKEHTQCFLEEWRRGDIFYLGSGGENIAQYSMEF
jgi:hypothetical protein